MPFQKIQRSMLELNFQFRGLWFFFREIQFPVTLNPYKQKSTIFEGKRNLRSECDWRCIAPMLK